jgi:hypothetical protein
MAQPLLFCPGQRPTIPDISQLSTYFQALKLDLLLSLGLLLPLIDFLRFKEDHPPR